MKIIIVGGGAGGASVAARLRRLDESNEIVLFDKGKEISQATCGIPYYIGQVIKDRDRMIVVEPEAFASILNVDVRTESKVLHINPKEKTVTVSDIRACRIYKEPYDKLVLSTGTSPNYPDFINNKVSNVYTLYNLYDMDEVIQHLGEVVCNNAVIIGGGFIGIEAAENLQARGLNVTLIEAGPQVMPIFDEEISAMMHHHLVANGVNLILNDTVVELSKEHVKLKSGNSLKADIILLGIGARPHIDLAQKAGLKIGELGGVNVNNGLVTSDEHIYALGDAVEVSEALHKNKTILQLASPAHKQAAVIAANLTGDHKSYEPVHGNSIIKVCDLIAAITGYSEKQLKKLDISYQKSYVEVTSHASYYPEAFPVTIKLLFSKNRGKLLGAQVIGIKGVDKRIDVISTAIQYGGSVFDLAKLELAYAPPFSSAKDPVNIAGMVARNMLLEDYRVIFWDQLDSFRETDSVIVDVRTADEFELNGLEGAINIPIEAIRNRNLLRQLPKDKTIILYCQQGKKSYFAFRVLSQLGYKKVYSLSGGLKLYKIATTKPSVGIQKMDSPISEPELMGDQIQVAEILDQKHEADHSVPRMLEIDATGLSCPGPILKLKKSMRKINKGESLMVTATDQGFSADVKVWCKKTGHILESCDTKNSIITAIIHKPDVVHAES